MSLSASNPRKRRKASRLWHLLVGHDWWEWADRRDPWLHCDCGARLTRADWP
jgi:hypothetical protein